MVREEQPRSLCDAAGLGHLMSPPNLTNQRRWKMQGHNTLGCLWVKLLLYQQGLGPSSMTQTHLCQSAAGNFQQSSFISNWKMLLRPRAWAQFAGETSLSFGFWEGNDSNGSSALQAAPGAAPPPASTSHPQQGRHWSVSRALIRQPGADLSAALPQSTRRSCLSPHAAPANGVWQGESEVCNQRTWGCFSSEHRMEMKQHSTRWFPPQLLMSLCSIQTSQSLSAEARDILSRGRQKKDGLRGHKRRMDWITGELRCFRKIKLLSTEAVPHVGLGALESSSIL